MKEITIAGGGLAGLSLGLSLRQKQIPVTLYEASSYPKHKVCGEFMTGKGLEVLKKLKLEGALKTYPRHREIHWMDTRGPVFSKTIQDQALGVSRWTLDNLMAEAFVEAGGNLIQNQRIQYDSQTAGMVNCSGRKLSKSSPWVGLKMHFSGLKTSGDLEMHIASKGYFGLSLIEDGKVNVCGLMHGFRSTVNKADRLAWFLDELNQLGLSRLASRLQDSEPDLDSFSSVTHLEYHLKEEPNPGFHIGDARTLIPPFTGNGMSLAMENALLASGFLEAWAKGESSWEESLASYQDSAKACFRRRTLAAKSIQIILLKRNGFGFLRRLARMRMLPFNLMYHLTHY